MSDTTTIQIQGYQLKVDADFAADINPDLWTCCHVKGVPYFRSSYRGKVARLHRVVMNAPRGMCVDHINGDTLDNRRSNLRICTRGENNTNRGMRKTNTSGKKGVHRIKGNLKNPWRTQINAQGKRIHVGVFATLEEASAAYDQAALKYHGQFAQTNLTTQEAN